MRIAVVGSGIGGLGAAWLLARAHEVEVFERDERLGGHTHTVRVARPGGGDLALDTGFIVHNEVTYPRLVRMFRELGVLTQPSRMGFSVTCRRHGVEYSGVRLHLQPEALARPGMPGLLRALVRFQRTAARRALAPDAAGLTLRELAWAEGYPAGFRDHYLAPLAAAVWSAGAADALDFPAAYVVRFWRNHGMLGFRRLRWRTVTGGSDTYVRAIRARLPGPVHAGLGVVEVRRHPDGVHLRTADDRVRRYDQVVLAAHPDQALAMLADPSDEERRVLGAFRYTASDTVLHDDSRLLPVRRRARASWNYHLDDCGAPGARPSVTYSLNRLQQLDAEREYCVTLNRTAAVAPERVIRRMRYEHPAYSFAALAAQDALPALQGARRTWYSGAWTGYGFHEDGLRAAARVAAALGVPW